LNFSRRNLSFKVLLAVLAAAVCASAKNPPVSKSPKTGRLTLTFDERSPISSLAEFNRRAAGGGKARPPREGEREYAIADESFEAYVPKACREDNPHGLLVWISPGKAVLPRDWQGVLDRHKLIWICPDNAGNNRDPRERLNLGLDAVHNMKARYPVDESRLYISGFSGGGRCASIAAVGYPDVFTGGLFMMGCNFYRVVRIDKQRAYPAGAFKPAEELFDQAREHPLVLLTAERDMNRDQTKANYEAFKEDGFRNVTYLEVPKIGHTAPPATWLVKALDALKTESSEPLPRPTTRPAASGKR
jgi:hypothetical protein